MTGSRTLQQVHKPSFAAQWTKTRPYEVAYPYGQIIFDASLERDLIDGLPWMECAVTKHVTWQANAVLLNKAFVCSELKSSWRTLTLAPVTMRPNSGPIPSVYCKVVVCRRKRGELCSVWWVGDSLQPISNNQNWTSFAFPYASRTLGPRRQTDIQAVEEQSKIFCCCLFSASEALLVCDAWKRCGHVLLITLK